MTRLLWLSAIVGVLCLPSEIRGQYQVIYLNRDVDVELGYCVLSKLVAEILDGNCTGIYIPRENTLIPNDETAYLELQKIASSRDSGVTAGVTPD